MQEVSVDLVNVRFGSKADMPQRQTNVRFTPESGHGLGRQRCLLCAKSGHCRTDELIK
jgi:hypothetical protein